MRAGALVLDKATNYGVVRLELLEDIYNQMYSYQLQYEREDDWPHRILNHREVTGMRNVTTANGQPAVELHVQNNSGKYCRAKPIQLEKITVDLVIVASGYRRNIHEQILSGLDDLMPRHPVDHDDDNDDNDDNDHDTPTRPAASKPQNPQERKSWTVRRDYGIEFERGAVQSDAGIWLQGCNEKTHGLSDTLLSILAVRSGEMVESIFGAGLPAAS